MARFVGFALALLALAALASPRAQAAASLDHCDETIATLPAEISAPGSYCVLQDFAVVLETGVAITIDADNVVLYCHGHKIDNDGATSGTIASGVRAVSQTNVVVRDCRFEGFATGIDLQGSSGSGHLVEDSQAVNSRSIGIAVQGDGSIVRRNRVYNTGGSAVSAAAIGIFTVGGVDVLDNTVTTLLPTTDGSGVGIFANANPAGTIAGNRVRDVHNGTDALAVGIQMIGNGRVLVAENDLVGAPGTDSLGLFCSNPAARARDNAFSGWGGAIATCTNSSRNVVHP